MKEKRRPTEYLAWAQENKQVQQRSDPFHQWDSPQSPYFLQFHWQIKRASIYWVPNTYQLYYKYFKHMYSFYLQNNQRNACCHYLNLYMRKLRHGIDCLTNLTKHAANQVKFRFRPRLFGSRVVSYTDTSSSCYRQYSVQFRVVSDSSRPHDLQHARPPCPSPTPRVYSNSCLSSRWCHLTISSSVVPFSHLQSFPASGSFQMSQLFASGSQSIGVSAAV